MSGKTATKVRSKRVSAAAAKTVAVKEPVRETVPERPVEADEAVEHGPATGLFLRDHVCVFDRNWYLRAYPDVAAAGIDPVEHYQDVGYKEGRAPNRFFNPAAYRALHPDLAFYDGDLFMHYIFHGALEGRNIT